MAQAQPSEVQTHHRALENGVCLVTVKGEIDLASAPVLRSALVRLRQAGNRQFVLELSGVTHMDSTGLGVVLSFFRSLEGGGEVALAAAPQNVLTLLKVTGLERRLPTFASIDEAIAGIPPVRDGPSR
jgi:anti-sigma B factor antagonist